MNFLLLIFSSGGFAPIVLPTSPDTTSNYYDTTVVGLQDAITSAPDLQSVEILETTQEETKFNSDQYATEGHLLASTTGEDIGKKEDQEQPTGSTDYHQTNTPGSATIRHLPRTHSV